ncbi:GNAT family N-acetyltransferase [Oceanobacillus senegalensis]|uniref:GNAT family N-acetyltransferase n=1 Tax=Oceanobacillus senegalensis TaxID=1936063 RepID=UPI001FE44054|nr:GNAT family N-acetyltransferase [Oceanobacillus senegalensis]
MSVADNDVNIHIRTGQLDDAQAILDIQRYVIMENKFLISVPDEFDRTLEQQKKWMRNVLENKRETIMIAEKDDEVIGWLVFESPNRKRLSHTGSFEMMIHKDVRGKGIGKMLIMELLNWAEKNPFIEKVSLGVFSTNKRAISLYKRMGFIEEGRKYNEIKLSEHEYADDILMYKYV